MGMAPASFIRLTEVASTVGTCSVKRRDPLMVRTYAVSNCRATKDPYRARVARTAPVFRLRSSRRISHAPTAAKPVVTRPQPGLSALPFVNAHFHGFVCSSSVEGRPDVAAVRGQVDTLNPCATSKARSRSESSPSCNNRSFTQPRVMPPTSRNRTGLRASFGGQDSDSTGTR